MRCFISINIPEEIKKEINKIQNNLPLFSGKKTESENLHLTLKFLGEIDNDKIEGVRKKLEEIKFKKFNCQIKNLGFFSPKFIRIIWLYLSNCGKLQGIIDDKLKKLFKKEKRFMSHLTIARIKKVENKKEFLENLNKIKIPEIKFSVNCFYLMKSELSSQGPKYEIIEKYELD